MSMTSIAGAKRVPDAKTRRTVLIARGHPDYLVQFHGPLIRQLVGRGHRVVACCPDAEPHHLEALRNMGAEHVDFPFERRGINPIADFRTSRTFVRTMQEISPDVALLITVKPIIYGVRALRRIQCRYVFAMLAGTGYLFGDRRGLKERAVAGIGTALLRGALKRCSGVLLHNPDDAEELRDQGMFPSNMPTHVTYGSGIDLEEFAPIPLPERRNVLMIARLIPEKGVREFAEAARIVRQSQPDVTFSLVGWFEDGINVIDREEVDAWVAAGDITFVGKLSDVRPAIAEALIFSLPTYYREGLPRTILEAMAMGRPIVTTDRPGCRETVRPGLNGHLVPPRDSETLAETLLGMLGDAPSMQQMGAESRRMAEQQFGSAVNAEGIVDFMKTVSGSDSL